MRTERYRLTEWVYLRDEGQETQAPIWDWDQHADWGELYDLWEGEHQPLQEGGSTPHQAESEENPASRMAQVMIRIDKI